MEQKPKTWIKYILSRIAKNKNFLGFVAGQTGSGKSYSCLSIAEQLDPEFSEERIIFTGLELMTLINSGKLHSGSVVIFEESGVEACNRNWQSTTNKMLNFLAQTFRHRNFIILFNSPAMDFLDSGLRRLFHAELTTTGIDFATSECLLKPVLLQYNARLRKMYYHRLKGLNSKGQYAPITIWRVKKPSEDLIKKYEVKKKAYTDNLNNTIMTELQKDFDKKAKKSHPELTETQKEYLTLLEAGHNLDYIAQKLSRSKGTIYQSIKLIEKKGYDIRPIFNDVGSIDHYTVTKRA